MNSPTIGWVLILNEFYTLIGVCVWLRTHYWQQVILIFIKFNSLPQVFLVFLYFWSKTLNRGRHIPEAIPCINATVRTSYFLQSKWRLSYRMKYSFRIKYKYYFSDCETRNVINNRPRFTFPGALLFAIHKTNLFSLSLSLSLSLSALPISRLLLFLSALDLL